MINPDATPEVLLNDFFLEQVAAQPTERALLLYRSFAAQTDNTFLASRCSKIADDIERLQHAQLLLRLEYQRSTV